MYDFSHLNKFETYEGDDSQQHSASPLKQKRRENFANYHVKRPELKNLNIGGLRIRSEDLITPICWGSYRHPNLPICPN